MNDFLRNLVGDKPWFRSLTLVGAAVFTAGQAYFGVDALGVELPYADIVSAASIAIGGLLVPAGLRKKAQEIADGLAALFAEDEEDDGDPADFED